LPPGIQARPIFLSGAVFGHGQREKIPAQNPRATKAGPRRHFGALENATAAGRIVRNKHGAFAPGRGWKMIRPI